MLIYPTHHRSYFVLCCSWWTALCHNQTLMSGRWQRFVFSKRQGVLKREDQMCISFVLSLMADWRNRLWFIAKHAVHFSYARCGPEWTSSLNGPRKCTVCCSRNTKEADRECQPGVRSHGICLMSGVVVGRVARLARRQVHLVLNDFLPWCLSCVTPCPFRKNKTQLRQVRNCIVFHCVCDDILSIECVGIHGESFWSHYFVSRRHSLKSGRSL